MNSVNDASEEPQTEKMHKEEEAMELFTLGVFHWKTSDSL